MKTSIVTKDSILNLPSEGVTDDEWPSIRLQLHLGMQKHKKAVGFASVQFGTLKRAFVMSKGEVLIFFKNPRYVKNTGDTYMHTEGCMSIPKKSFKVQRYPKVQIHDDINGSQIFEGFLAAVVQHEMDHLEGQTIKELGV
jgi:peptide deformylase